MAPGWAAVSLYSTIGLLASAQANMRQSREYAEAHRAHLRAALTEKTQAGRTIGLAYAEDYACKARRYKQWADALMVAYAEAKEQEHADT